MKNALEIASAEMGVKEVRGKKANPRILQYAKDTGFRGYKSDETAWCSLFTNWVAYKAGLERSKSLLARSWLKVGVPVEHPEPGDLVVFWRKKRNSIYGHVGFFNGFSEDGTRVFCLGGNQKNMVSITGKSVDEVLGYRRLRFVDENKLSTKVLKRGDTGSEVMKLQDTLKQLGFNCGTSDGFFGPKTEQSVMDFQAAFDTLDINGIFDKPTRESLNSIINHQ